MRTTSVSVHCLKCSVLYLQWFIFCSCEHSSWMVWYCSRCVQSNRLNTHLQLHSPRQDFTFQFIKVLSLSFCYNPKPFSVLPWIDFSLRVSKGELDRDDGSFSLWQDNFMILLYDRCLLQLPMNRIGILLFCVIDYIKHLIYWMTWLGLVLVCNDRWTVS